MAFGAAAPSAVGQSDLIQDGKVGYVVASIAYGLSNSTDTPTICPQGMS